MDGMGKGSWRFWTDSSSLTYEQSFPKEKGEINKSLDGMGLLLEC
jgi:hypothetical protein